MKIRALALAAAVFSATYAYDTDDFGFPTEPVRGSIAQSIINDFDDFEGVVDPSTPIDRDNDPNNSLV